MMCRKDGDSDQKELILINYIHYTSYSESTLVQWIDLV